MGSGALSSQPPLGGSNHEAEDDSDTSFSDASVHSPLFDQLDAPVITLSRDAKLAWRAAGGKLASGSSTLSESPMPKRDGGCAWRLDRKVASLGGVLFPAASVYAVAVAAVLGIDPPK